jgi:hypothetical protein
LLLADVDADDGGAGDDEVDVDNDAVDAVADAHQRTICVHST